MGNLAIIPARGGSKRIPRKNIRDFCGKPIIAYSIESALKSGLFEEVMVSTDDAEIAEIARSYGAKVPFLRSAQNADDFATTMDVIREVLEKYKEAGKTFEYVCCIYPTAPLIRAEHLAEGFSKLATHDYQSVFPVVRFSYPVQRGLKMDETGTVSMVWPEHLNTRSQDLQTIYHDAGQWYWLNPEAVTDAIFTEASGAVILKEQEVQDIDTLEDWKIAEIKYSLLNISI